MQQKCKENKRLEIKELMDKRKHHNYRGPVLMKWYTSLYKNYILRVSTILISFKNICPWTSFYKDWSFLMANFPTKAGVFNTKTSTGIWDILVQAKLMNQERNFNR